jgi:hypothetical protein
VATVSSPLFAGKHKKRGRFTGYNIRSKLRSFSMILKRSLRDGRNLKFTLSGRYFAASLALMALLALPAESFAAPCSKSSPHDFDGDCKSDILWHNETTGAVSVWLMNGTALANHANPGALATSVSAQGIADFDGDGKADILWRNNTTGAVSVWLMNGTALSSHANAGTLATNWSIQGIGDFDGDGKADILWHNDTTGAVSVWLMNGTGVGSRGSPGAIATSWSIHGIGDFDGDGKADILWHNDTTGQVAVWLMNGTALASHANPGTLATSWTIQSIGDFNGDGKADIFWHNDSTGAVSVWLMNGTARASQGSPGAIATAWQIAPQSPNGCPNSVLCTMLAAMNNVRANGPFGTGNPAPSATTGGALFPFAWSASAATVARNYAAQCSYGHNPNVGPFGENIFAAGSTATPVTLTGTDVVSDWAAEVENYDYNSNSCAIGETCGHYTQLVWRNTTAVGCAVQQCTTNSPFGTSFPDWAFAVCDFSPPGNFNDVMPY